MDLKIDVKQSQQLSPRMVQNLEVLQMGSLQLLEYIQNLAQENPTVEADENTQTEIESFENKLRWLASNDIQNKVYYKADEDGYDPFYAYDAERDETLSEYLLKQLGAIKIPENIAAAVRFIVESLDESGFLPESDEVIAESVGCTASQAAQAAGLVQSLDPPGAGARSLSQCLLIQLRGAGDALAEDIAENHLALLGKNQYNRISKLTGAPEPEVVRACNVIRSLNPRPASGFAAKEKSVYITPDLFVVTFPEHFELITNDYYFPSVKINDYYSNLYKNCGDKEVKQYLSEKLKQAKWAMGSIDQRKKMILRCAEIIVERQVRFFRFGPGNLVPMTLSDLSNELSVHDSTVSRAVKDKYLQCASGIYPLSYFFTRSIGPESGGMSSDRAQAEIRDLLDSEDVKKPYSDSALCQLLKQRGIEISRRTVAKYRDAMGIGSTNARRQR